MSCSNFLRGRIESTVSKTEAQFHGAAANMHESTRHSISIEISRLSDRLDTFDKMMKEHTISLVGSLPETIASALTKGGPSIWAATLVLIAVQLALVGAYLYYRKKDREYHPKYL